MTRRQFRILLGVGCLLFVLALVLAIVSRHFLPPELQAYLDAQAPEDLSWQDALLFTGVAALLILFVVTTVGLWRFRRWARGVRLWSDLFMFVLSAYVGPVVMTGLAYTVASVGTLIEGGLLALVYLSPMAAWFSGTPETPTTSAFRSRG